MFRVCIGLALALCLARESAGNEISQIQSLVNKHAYAQAFRLGQKLEHRLANSAEYNQMMILLADQLNYPEEAFFARSRLRSLSSGYHEVAAQKISSFTRYLPVGTVAGLRYIRMPEHLAP